MRIIAALFIVIFPTLGWADQPFVLPYERHVLTGNNGDPVVYYITKPEKPSPLVVIVDNAICFSVFEPDGTGHYVDHEGILISWRERPQFTYMVVEHPYVLPSERYQVVGRTSSQLCPRMFLERDTVEYFVSEALAAVADAIHLPQVKPAPLLMMGQGVNAVTALIAAQKSTDITHIALNDNLGNPGLWLYTNGIFTDQTAVGDQERQAIAFLKRLEIAAPDDTTRLDHSLGDATPMHIASLRRNVRVNLIGNNTVKYYINDYISDTNNVAPLAELHNYLVDHGFKSTIYLHQGPKDTLDSPSLADDFTKDCVRPLDWFQRQIQTDQGVQQ